MNNIIKKFLLKDLSNLLIPIFLLLSLMSGFSIIYSMQYLGGPFRVENIYAMYATIAQLFLMVFPVLIWGTEFRHETINLLKASKLKMSSLYLIKFLTSGIVTFLFAVCSVSLLVFYDTFYGINNLELETVLKIFLAYFLFGFFMFGVASLVTMLSKKDSTSIIVMIAINAILPMFCTLFGGLGEWAMNIIKYFPYAFIENRFSFATFTPGEVISVLMFGIVLNLIAYLVLEKG